MPFGGIESPKPKSLQCHLSRFGQAITQDMSGHACARAGHQAAHPAEPDARHILECHEWALPIRLPPYKNRGHWQHLCLHEHQAGMSGSFLRDSFFRAPWNNNSHKTAQNCMRHRQRLLSFWLFASRPLHVAAESTLRRSGHSRFAEATISQLLVCNSCGLVVVLCATIASQLRPGGEAVIWNGLHRFGTLGGWNVILHLKVVPSWLL